MRKHTTTGRVSNKQAMVVIGDKKGMSEGKAVQDEPVVTELVATARGGSGRVGWGGGGGGMLPPPPPPPPPFGSEPALSAEVYRTRLADVATPIQRTSLCKSLVHVLQT